MWIPLYFHPHSSDNSEVWIKLSRNNGRQLGLTVVLRSRGHGQTQTGPLENAKWNFEGLILLNLRALELSKPEAMYYLGLLGARATHVGPLHHTWNIYKNMRFLCYLIVVKLSLLEAQSSLVKSKFRVKSMVIGISGLNWWNPNFCWKTESSTRQAAFHPTQVSSVQDQARLEHRSRDHRLSIRCQRIECGFHTRGYPKWIVYKGKSC